MDFRSNTGMKLIVNDKFAFSLTPREFKYYCGVFSDKYHSGFGSLSDVVKYDNDLANKIKSRCLKDYGGGCYSACEIKLSYKKTVFSPSMRYDILVANEHHTKLIPLYLTFPECRDYIDAHNGIDEVFAAYYIKGTISVIQSSTTGTKPIYKTRVK
jgi:hypothetical protein